MPDPPPFTSILALPVSRPGNALGVDPARVHVLAGPTKTFGASGIKVGALVSQHHSTLRRMLAAALNATPVSAAADALMTQVLLGARVDNEDGEQRNNTDATHVGTFARWFLNENVHRLSSAFELVASWCEFHQLRYVPILSSLDF